MRCIGCGVKTRGTWEGHTWLALCEDCNDHQVATQPTTDRRAAAVHLKVIGETAGPSVGRGVRLSREPA